MRDVVRSGAFDTMQVPYNLLNPSAGHAMPDTFTEVNYGSIIEDCAAQGMGVFSIRVFAGGALAGRPPSAHTRTTPFFPRALYERDQRHTAHVAALLGPNRSLKADALRFTLANPHISAAIIGFSSAIGAYGGFFIPKAFWESLKATGGPETALALFFVFYLSCLVGNWAFYARRGSMLHGAGESAR